MQPLLFSTAGKFNKKPLQSILQDSLLASHMDEAAFVESLFAPEMRSTSSLFPSPLPLSCGRVKTLMESDRCPPTSNTFVPPPPNSLLGGGIALSQLQAPYQPPLAEDVPLFVRLNEDDMFSQMLTEQDFSDFQHHHSTNFKNENANIVKPLSNTNSVGLEPLDLPRDNEEQCLNDSTTFQNAGVSRPGIPSSSAMNSIHGYTLDGNLMPFGPFTPVYFAGDFSNYPPPLHSWIQEEQGDVSASSNINFQRVYTMKHVMTGVGMMHQQPSPGAVDMFDSVTTSCHHSASPELWISTSRNARQDISERKMKKQSFDVIKTLVERPPLSLTISPPASLTDKALKELIVSADFGTPTASRQKRARTVTSDQDTDDQRAKTARTTSTSTSPSKAAGKSIKGKKCVEFGCTRRAQSNSRCKAHGGGARCQYAGPGGCIRSSQGGGFCRAHGGGKRCEFPGCTRGQQRKGRCYVHGGIRKCQYGTCEKKDRGNGFCISHGGGKRCEHPNCSRAVRRGLQCQIHETQPKERGGTVLL